MSDKRTQAAADAGNMQKDPADGVTGDEPMTGAQRSYLETLSKEAKQRFDDSLSKVAASRRIEELQRITGRGNTDVSSPQASESSAGEEDPGAALTDPAIAGAMRGAAQKRAQDQSAERIEQQEKQALHNVQGGYGKPPKGSGQTPD